VAQFNARFGTAYDLYFTMIDAATLRLAVTGDWTPATGDTKISKDGGNVANTTNNPAVVGGSGSVLWKLTLTLTEMQATDVLIQIVDSATIAVEDNVFLITTIQSGAIEANRGIIIGEVDDTTFSPTTIALEGFRLSPNLTEEATSSHYNDRVILFTSGNLLGQSKEVTSYSLANSKEKFGYAALTDAPADGDRYIVV